MSTETLNAVILSIALVVASVPPLIAQPSPAPSATELQAARDRGASALAAGRTGEAEAAFRGVLMQQPDDVAARLGLARALAAGGRPIEALAEVRTTLRDDPAPLALAVAGGVVAGLGRTDEALELFATLRAKAPGDLGGYLAPALLLRDAGRPEEAIALLRDATERGIDDPRLVTEYALLELAAGEVVAAHRRARAAWDRGHETAAVATVVGLAAAGGGASVETAIEWLERSLALGTAQASVVRLTLAGALLDRERPTEALAQLDALGRTETSNPEWHYKRGQALRALGESAAADGAMVRFRELTAGAVDAENAARELGTALNEAQALAAQDRVAEALEQVDRLRSEHPEFAPIRALRAKLLFSMRRPVEALDEIRRARELSPGRTEYHYLEGVFAASLERWAEAEEAAERALTLDRELDSAQQLLAEIRRRAASE